MPEQPPTRYPEAWKPRGAPDFEPEPEPEIEPSIAMHIAAAAMDDETWAAFVRRSRGDRA